MTSQATKPQRSTYTLRPRARLLAEQRARLNKISLGEALSDLVEAGADNAPRARLEMRDGLPTFITPPGSPAITSEMVKEVMDNEW